MSYEPFVLPQTNQTLHSSAIYRGTIDASAFGAEIQPIITPAHHLGRFCPVTAWSHGDLVGHADTLGLSIVSLGWSTTSPSTTSQFADLAALTSSNCARATNRFVEVPLIGSVATPVHPVPAGQPIVCRVGTKAGSTSTGAAYTQPAVGGTVLVTLSPSANWPIIGGAVYVGAIGSAFDTYVVTARTGVSPYVSITLQLLIANAVAPGGTVPAGRTLAAAATFSLFMLGNHRRARWEQ